MDFVREAESLIRSLAGVVQARIHASPTGIDAVHVIAADDQAAAYMAGHVRSALLAGLATPVVPGRIHVRTGGTGAAPAAEDGAAADAGGHRDTAATVSRDRLRLLATTPDAVHEQTPAPTLAPEEPENAAALPHGGDDLGPRTRQATATERARLVTVDVQRPGDGRVRCRVSVAWEAYVHRAEAIAVDLPGAAAQAAAQAAVRALASGGLHGLELSGLREVEIAGKDYVLVALRRSDGPAVRHRSGSALMFGSPERSAAEAAVCAANELL